MSFKNKARQIRNKLYCLPWKILYSLGIYQNSNIPIKYVSERANWAIKNIGQNLKREIDIISPNKIEVSTDPSRCINQVVHFGSQYMWLNWESNISSNNFFISTFFHGKPSDGEEVKIHIDKFLKSTIKLDKVITASSLIETRLLDWGIDSKKLIKIPIGVNTDIFNYANESQKKEIRKSLNIPQETIVIGSFQKDGVGWGNGLEPKLIKGPDIFISTLKKLVKKGLPIFALITGPARGYVIQNLERNNIPYHHSFVTEVEELVPLYKALDLYLITSREEGGPMGLLESTSCGIPVISTNVGMAKDVIVDGITGYICNEFESSLIADKTELFLNKIHNEKNNNFHKTIRKETLKFDWKEVAKLHWQMVYSPLMQ